jgi:hypothetical protein
MLAIYFNNATNLLRPHLSIIFPVSVCHRLPLLAFCPCHIQSSGHFLFIWHKYYQGLIEFWHISSDTVTFLKQRLLYLDRRSGGTMHTGFASRSEHLSQSPCSKSAAYSESRFHHHGVSELPST